MPFIQTAPGIGNQYTDDRVLQTYLTHTLPPDILQEIEPELKEMGELAGDKLYRMQLADRCTEPLLTSWDPWGNRIDHIEITPLWKVAERLAAEKGLIATAYERKHGKYSRIHQMALAYLFTPATDIYSCPLAMTDGAANTLLSTNNVSLIERALPHLVSRDPQYFWTSGQWMTEAIGGSDVGLSETIARQDNDGQWHLYGHKWFTSATTSPMALTLARPEGNGPGGKGLALFYIEIRDDLGYLQNISIHRLKDKLGTRKVPTAELTLEGTPAILVAGTGNGVKNITPMLNITRIWNSVSAIALMRRGIALARDYSRKRRAFGGSLSEKPLHIDTLADLQAEFEAAFHLTFYTVGLLGKKEAGEFTAEEEARLRFLTPILKLTTAKQGVSVVSEVLEAFGGAGYVEDTGLPVLLRDAQVLPIWEGTTNVLALDSLRALDANKGLGSLCQEVNQWLTPIHDTQLREAAQVAQDALTQASQWLQNGVCEAGARRFALTVGRSLELALMIRHAQQVGEYLAMAAALRFSKSRINLIVSDLDPNIAEALANDFVKKM